MSKKILIIGSTGTLGSKLINFCYNKKIKVHTITSFKNKKKLLTQKKKLKSNNIFNLSDSNDKIKFQKFLKISKFKIIYFLDYGSESLLYLDLLLKNNNHSIFAIANKEMIIAGGLTLRNKILETKNKLIPLDSEHFSLQNNNFNNENITKVFITASGGPFFFKKKY